MNMSIKGAGHKIPTRAELPQNIFWMEERIDEDTLVRAREYAQSLKSTVSDDALLKFIEAIRRTPYSLNFNWGSRN